MWFGWFEFQIQDLKRRLREKSLQIVSIGGLESQNYQQKNSKKNL